MLPVCMGVYRNVLGAQTLGGTVLNSWSGD